MKTALIIGGGDSDPLLISRVHSRSTILICADHGADAALEAGLIPNWIVGDLDSIDDRTRQHFQEHGVDIEQDRDGDHLDTELAILKAIEAGAERLIIFGAWGDRIDQSLPVFGFLTPEQIPISIPGKLPSSFQGEVYIVTERCLISHIRPNTSIRIPSPPDSRLGLVPLPEAGHVRTTGLYYELNGTDLTFSRTMSISNLASGDSFDLSYDTGSLAVIQWFADPATLEHRVRELTGRESELEQDREYYSVIREIYDHGGKGPTDPEGKADRLVQTRTFLDTLVPNHTDLRIIHLAGTSGKGSTALFLHSILEAWQRVRQKTGKGEPPGEPPWKEPPGGPPWKEPPEGHRTGLLTSPHIHDPNERIMVDNSPIPHSDLVRIWRDLLPGIRALEAEHDVVFLYQEILLLIALRHFIETGVEWAVIETGLGGRFDQTRALEADITAITQIDLDHTHILGTTIQDIAFEKAGIIRTDVPLHTAETDQSALEVFERICESHGSTLIRCIPRIDETMEQRDLTIHGHTFPITQPGDHQSMNAALAASIALDPILSVPPDIIRSALHRVRLPGRIEVRGDLIIDTGHNPRELRTLSRTLGEVLPAGSRKIVLCGMAETKDHRGMLDAIAGFADTVILTKAGYRGMDPELLRSVCRAIQEFARVGSVITEPDANRAYRVGKLLQKEYRGSLDRGEGSRAVLIVTGSTFLVDEIFNPDPELRRINSS